MQEKVFQIFPEISKCAMISFSHSFSFFFGLQGNHEQFAFPICMHFIDVTVIRMTTGVKFQAKLQIDIQLPTFAYIWLLNKLYENEVTLTGQNLPLKGCQAFEILTQLKMGLDLLMLKIWGLQIKGLQNYYQTIKVVGLKKKSVIQPRPYLNP